MTERTIGLLLATVLACQIAAAAEAVDKLTLQECLRKGEQAYIRGDCVRAMVLFTRAVALDPDSRDALQRLEFVADELQFLDDHYKEWLRIMSENEAAKSRQFEEKVDEAMTVLRAENTQRISELRRESIRFVTTTLKRQDATIRRLEKKLDHFRFLTIGLVLLGLSVFAVSRRRVRKRR